MRTTLRTLAVIAGLAAAAPAPAATQSTQIVPLARPQADVFGASVAIADDVLVVGTPTETVGGEPAPGAAYVFGRTAGRWSQRQRMPDPNAATTASFGAAVAVSGTRFVIGAPDEDAGAGAVYLFDFDRIRGGWTQRQRIVAAPRVAGSRFGASLALSGDFLAVGAPDETSGAGAVYTFTPSAPDFWSPMSRVLPSDTSAGQGYGTSVALDGQELAVGAPGDTSGRGAVYAHENSGRNWIQRKKLLPTAPTGSEALGVAVSIEGGTIVGGCGARRAAFAYTRGANGYAAAGTLEPADDGDDRFGAAVAVAGDTLCVGAPFANAGRGALHVYARRGTTFVEREVLAPQDLAADAHFGSSAAASGDLVLAGAPRDAAPSEARVFDLLDVVNGYMLPSKASYAPPAAKRVTPGFRASGILDTGTSSFDFAAAGTLRIGALVLPVSGLTQAKSNAPWSYDDGTLSFQVRPLRAGSSRAAFTLEYTGALGAAGLAADAPFTVSYQVGDVQLAGGATLDGFAFDVARAPGSLQSPAFTIEKLAAKAKKAGKATLAVTARFVPVDGAPESAPNVVVRFGDAIDQRLDAAAFKRRKSSWTWSGDLGAGSGQVTVDYAKGLVTVKAKKLGLVGAADGQAPLAFAISLDGYAYEARVVSVSKGAKYTY